MKRSLVVGNWKMFGGQEGCLHLARQIIRQLRNHPTRAELVLAPPFTSLASVAQALRRSTVGVAAQNSHWAESGAFTGEVSAPMLEEIGCRYVILGHSERRHVFHENDAMIARKLSPVLAHGMRPILCVGETLSARQRKKTLQVVTAQLDSALKGLAKDVIDKVEIAYEPVWAIGTGQNATAEQVDQVHSSIRAFLRSCLGKARGNAVRILYGGSVKPENASTLAAIEEVNGFLVGGASLNAESFLAIARAFSARAK